MKLKISLFLSALALASLAMAAEPTTAYEAVKIANKEINTEARNKVIQILGEESSSSVLPDKWKILFFDPYAKQDGRLIEVWNGKVTGIRDGYSQLDEFRLFAYKPEEIMPPQRLKIDSNQILEILKRSTALQDVKITHLRLSLLKPDSDSILPVWNVTIFAGNRKTGKGIELGEARISAESGEILHLKIDLKKLE